MAISRAAVVDANFQRFVAERAPQPRRTDLDQPVVEGSGLTARAAMRLFEAQIESRTLDLLARELKARGESFYTIGSAGHEGNAVLADHLGPEDMAFLHYRSGAFYCARAMAHPGPEGPFDVLLGVVASADEPIAGGRHKVFGSVPLNIPPQTSTIASHLPKALGHAVARDRKARLEGRPPAGISVATFGDASANHATATTAFNAAAWCTHQNVPAPVLFVCEDNGFGISVRTPAGWIAANFSNRAGIAWFEGDGLSLPSAWEAARRAVHHVRSRRQPAFLRLATVRLLGHAGSDVEQLYRSTAEIEAAEAADPLLHGAALLIDHGWMQPDEVLALYRDTRTRLEALAEEAIRRPKLRTREEVMAPLVRRDPLVGRRPSRVAPEAARREAFGGELPEEASRPRHLALQLNRALLDLLLAWPEAILFGEDVARKGGVYHVTAELSRKLGVGRVFNTMLDETTILGLALGAGHAGLLPLPEIQYLAYLMNAIDQLRGEAGSMQFFSNGQYANPMVCRIAGLAYQKGFGGHFHNDNGIAALREIPGLRIGCPSRGADGARMLRTLAQCASELGQPTVMLEPIALYMTRDLHQEGDGGWLDPYPPPDQALPLDEVGVYGEGTDLCIASFANGLYMSLRVAERLRAAGGPDARVIDLRWLQPLPVDALLPHVEAAGGRLLIVDECRRSSGIADSLGAEVVERLAGARIHRVTGADCYVPLGAAANLVLVQEADIEAGIHRLLGRSR